MVHPFRNQSSASFMCSERDYINLIDLKFGTQMGTMKYVFEVAVVSRGLFCIKNHPIFIKDFIINEEKH